MKKRWMIVSGLVVLCAALALAAIFLRPKQEAEMPQVDSLSVSTTVSLDFTEQTNGSWEFLEDLSSRKSPAWPDQIYTDEFVINDQLPKLVPTGGNTTLSGGWSADRTAYVSEDGTLALSVTGLAPGKTYRTALFLPCSDGSTAVCHSSVICRENEEKTPVFQGDFACVPGVYDDVTLVITGNAELYTHSFRVQVQNVSEQLRRDRDNGEYRGLYYGADRQSEPAWLRSGGPVAEETIKQAKSGITIAEPVKKDVYTGYDGLQLLRCTIALDRKYSPQDRFEVSYVLTDETGEKTVAEGKCEAEGKELETFTCLTAGVLLPETMAEGTYNLHTKVFRAGAAQSLGDDTVQFSLRREYDLSQLYGQYQRNALEFNLNCAENEVLAADGTYVKIGSDCLTVELRGMTPGVFYRCALLGTTQNGKPFECTFSCEPEEAQSGNVSFSLNIFTKSGIYSDLTLLAYGGGEQITHTFTCEVDMPQGQNNQYWDEIRFWTDDFHCVSGKPEEWPEPETGYAVNIPEDAVFSGYRGSILRLPFAFAPDRSGTDKIEIILAEESTGNVIEKITLSGAQEGMTRWEMGMTINGDFVPGAYILQTSMGQQQTKTRIFLEKEQTPREIFEDISTRRVRGVTAYENAQTEIIPKIRDYLDSMDGFDTDMFNQYLRYRYAPEEGMLRSFALLSPNVPESEATIDKEDLLFTANWLIRDTYRFQLKDIKHYSDAKLMDLDALYAFFGDTWKELKALDYAAGMGKDRDGTLYLWLPVYYENAQGGFEEDRLYLFVYILHEGADAAYLEGIEYYNDQLYNDYHTTQLLITDQTVVSDLLTAMCRASTLIYREKTGAEYPTLKVGSTGDAVWQLQRRLQRLGYLTTSVDAVFTLPVQEAVAAWLADAGMEESKEVTDRMQQILHDITGPRQLLTDWMKNHR